MKRMVALILCMSLLSPAYAARGGKDTKKPGSAAAPAAEQTDIAKDQKTSPPQDRQNVIKTDTPADAKGRIVSLWDWFIKGGIFMWPILLLAAVAMGFIIERFIVFRRAKLNPREFIQELEENIAGRRFKEIESQCARSDLKLARIIQKGLKLKSLGIDHVEKAMSIAGSIEVASLEKGLNILSAIGNIEPLLGFLGTVSGMIAAFNTIAEADQVSARLVAGGIYEALITTLAGLIVAIPALTIYNYFVHRIDSFAADVERITSDILELMVEENDTPKKKR